MSGQGKTVQGKSKGAAWVDPLRRPIVAATVPGTGLDVVVEPGAAELTALAEALDLDGIKGLRAEYRLARRAGKIIVLKGRLKATVRPTCVVTLEPFDLVIDEPVEMRFAEEHGRRDDDEPREQGGHGAGDADPPDVIENGEIDLGRVTTEFLSLAVPPFPRKPGVDFARDDAEADPSPFAALEKLKGQKD